MRAVRFDSFGALPYVTDVPDPEPPADGVVLEVTATGICRSDWHGWQGHDPDITVLPHIPGHELAGVVRARGAQVRTVSVGDRVTVPFVCACGTCPTCRAGDGQVCPHQWQPGFSGPGSFAQYVAIPHADHNLVPLPSAIDDATAAALGCRFATAYRAVRQVAAVHAGETVAVLGCGGVGLSAVMIAAAEGARVIAVDVHPDALAHARRLGAAEEVLATADAFDASSTDGIAGALRDLAPGGIDVGIDALGSPATAAASVAALRPRGRHVQVGLLPPAVTRAAEPFPMHLVIGRELQVLGSHGMAAHGYGEMLDRIASGRLRPVDLVTEVVGLDDVPDRLTRLAERTTTGIVVATPNA